MTNREETDAIRKILLRIYEKWKENEEGSVELTETVILKSGGFQMQEKSLSPPTTLEKDQELVTETVILSPSDKMNSSIYSPKSSSGKEGSDESLLASTGERAKGPAEVRGPKPGEEDFLADTVVLDRKKEAKQGKDGNRK